MTGPRAMPASVTSWSVQVPFCPVPKVDPSDPSLSFDRHFIIKDASLGTPYASSVCFQIFWKSNHTLSILFHLFDSYCVGKVVGVTVAPFHQHRICHGKDQDTSICSIAVQLVFCNLLLFQRVLLHNATTFWQFCCR